MTIRGLALLLAMLGALLFLLPIANVRGEWRPRQGSPLSSAPSYVEDVADSGQESGPDSSVAQSQGSGPPSSACSATVIESVSPASLCVRDPDHIIETAQVTVTAHITCPARLPLRVVFSIQNDCANCPGREAWSRRNKNSAATAARELADLAPTTSMCGVVSFGCGTRVQLGMTADVADCADAIHRIQTYSGRCIMPPPVEEQLLRETRVSQPPAVEVIVRYFRDPWNGSGTPWAAAESAISRLANSARAAGIHQSNICDSGFGLDPESGGTACDFASALPDRALYHDVRQAGKVTSDLRDLAALGYGVEPAEVTFTEEIGAQFDWVVGSGAPAPETDPRNPQRLSFEWSDVTVGQIVTATYSVRPRAIGLLPLRASASEMEIVDSLGRSSEAIKLPLRSLHVTECVTPTTSAVPTERPAPTTPVPTAVSTPTDGPAATSTPTLAASATSTVRPRPTMQPVPAYLPLALREHCVPNQQALDVALVIDASSSMLERTPAGRSRLDAAVEAARDFSRLLRLPDDHVALITFNAKARLLHPLTWDRLAIERALGGITTAQQSVLSEAVELAHRELLGSRRRPSSRAVMIVLSDGRANPEPPGLAVERARVAKAAGIEIFTIGTGEDGGEAALAAISSGPGYAYRTADAEDLGRIYATIAVTLPCPPDQYWGRR